MIKFRCPDCQHIHALGDECPNEQLAYQPRRFAIDIKHKARHDHAEDHRVRAAQNPGPSRHVR